MEIEDKTDDMFVQNSFFLDYLNRNTLVLRNNNLCFASETTLAILSVNL